MSAMKINGFTLAEVLITLGIIGVVAAMTMPALLNDLQNKQLETAFKKANSMVNQAFLKMEQETGDTFPSESIGGNQFKSMFMPYFKIIKDCGNSTCFPAATIGNTYKNYTKKVGISSILTDDGQFVTTDGMIYFIENPTTPSSNGYAVYVSIDVNGSNKRPNAWGHDLFTWQLNAEGHLVPMGTEGTNYPEAENCLKVSSSMTNGIGCTAKAIYDPEYFKNLPK